MKVMKPLICIYKEDLLWVWTVWGVSIISNYSDSYFCTKHNITITEANQGKATSLSNLNLYGETIWHSLLSILTGTCCIVGGIGISLGTDKTNELVSMSTPKSDCCRGDACVMVETGSGDSDGCVDSFKARSFPLLIMSSWMHCFFVDYVATLYSTVGERQATWEIYQCHSHVYTTR